MLRSLLLSRILIAPSCWASPTLSCPAILPEAFGCTPNIHWASVVRFSGAPVLRESRLWSSLPSLLEGFSSHLAHKDHSFEKKLLDFDPLPMRRTEAVLVRATQESDLQDSIAVTVVSNATIEASAGTFGDISRFLQTLPGVAAGNDQRNDFLVRGGNPSENLFLIDGIPVPNPNQLALSDTTGGFASMIDNDAVEGLSFISSVHEAGLQDRLSAVVAITTVPSARSDRRLLRASSLEAGISGVGLLESTPLKKLGRPVGTALFDLRRSVLNFFTQDIGINGVPIYTNAMIRADYAAGVKDKFWGMSLTGVDSVAIRPSAADVFETNPFDVDYRGWRNTTGLNWQHLLGQKTFSTVTVSNSEQRQAIHQYDQLLANQLSYSETTHEGTTRTAVQLTTQLSSTMLMQAGIEPASTRINYHIRQPIEVPTPYSRSMVLNESAYIGEQFSTASIESWVQGSIRLRYGIHVSAGARTAFWDYGRHLAFTPRATVSFPLYHSVASIGFAQYAQMPAFLFLLAFPQNHRLAPIRVIQTTAELRLIQTNKVQVVAATYQKLYSRYPVASTLPQLSMANVADTFGQSFLLFPMTSAGRGNTSGVEVTADINVLPRVAMTFSSAYARAWYSGLDGTLRRADIDIPFSASASSNIQLRKSLSLSMRYAGSSGRVYTPNDASLSAAQNRDVYDLACLNCRRSSNYGRFDFRLQGTSVLKNGVIDWNLGLLNAFNQHNFFAYQWQPRFDTGSGSADSIEYQLLRFPEGSVRYRF